MRNAVAQDFSHQRNNYCEHCAATPGRILTIESSSPEPVSGLPFPLTMSKLRDNTEPLRLALDRHSTAVRMDPALPLLPLPSAEIRSWFGEIDIYLFDQIIKGRFDQRRRVLDAGCGDGRNLIYFLRRGFTCFGVDENDAAIEHVRGVAATLAPGLSPLNFHVGDLDTLGRSLCGCGNLQRGAALRGRRRALWTDAARDVAGSCAGWSVLRAAGLKYRSGEQDSARTRPRESARWVGALRCRRADAVAMVRAARRPDARPDQDHQRAVSAVHDDVVSAEAGPGVTKAVGTRKEKG